MMIIAIILLAGFSIALPAPPESEENDGEVSRKILGSSVVTSVSVIMDIGNGSQTYYSDAVGKPMTKPSTATQLASPINLLNPDRYEFYTFDDSGDLVKRLMTLDEIQGIIASGDGEATNYNSQSLIGDEPEKRVDDVVSNVQNVLKEEIEAHKTSESKPTFDTSDVASNWNMILPTIFGGSNDNILPDKHNGATAETIVIENTTVLPEVNDTMMRTEVPVSEATKQTPMSSSTLMHISEMTTEQDTNANTRTNAPIITVEVNSKENITNDLAVDQLSADSKTENSYISEITSTTDNFKDIQSTQNIVKETPNFLSRPAITISSPAPFTTKMEETPMTRPPPTSTSSNINYATTSKPEEIRIPVTNPHSTTIFNKIDYPTTTRVEETRIPTTKSPLTTTSNKVNYVTSSTFYDRSTTTPVSSSFKPSLTMPSRRPITPPPMKTSTLAPKPVTVLSSKPLSSSPSILNESSITSLYKNANAQTTTISSLPKITTPQGLLSTFFLIEDYKHKPESTTKIYYTPTPFTATKFTTMESSTKQKSTSTIRHQSPTTLYTPTTSTYTRTTTSMPTEVFTEITTEENVTKENLKGYIDLSKTEETISLEETTYPTTQRFGSSENVIYTSTEDVATATTKPDIFTTTENEKEENLKRSTTEEESLVYSTTENSIQPNNHTTEQMAVSVTEKLNESDLTTSADTTTNKINDAERLVVTELLHQLFLTTNVYQINSELLGSTTLGNNEYTTEVQTSTEPKLEHTTELPVTTTSSMTLKSENVSELNIVSNIEHLILQSNNKPEQEIEDDKDAEKINQVILNTNSKPMSEVQIETATAASALFGTPNTEAAPNMTLSDEGINDAVDSLISQIIYQPSRTTIEEYLTTSSREKYTTEGSLTTAKTAVEQTTMLNVNGSDSEVINSNIVDTVDDRNRYEEMDLESPSILTTTEYESKTLKPVFVLKNTTNIDYTSENPEETNILSDELTQNKISSSTELIQEETQYQSTIYPQSQTTTEEIVEDITASAKHNDSELLTTTVPKASLKINKEEETTYDDNTSTETTADSTSKSNEILNIEASEFNQENYNETSEPFIIVTSSSEYPDYASTENIDVYTENIGSTTTSEEFKDTTTAFDQQTATTIQVGTATQNLLKEIKTETYPTTENNIGESTPEDSLKDYETTQDNFVSELYQHTSTENYIPTTNFATAKNDSFITTSVIQEVATISTTPKQNAEQEGLNTISTTPKQILEYEQKPNHILTTPKQTSEQNQELNSISTTLKSIIEQEQQESNSISTTPTQISEQDQELNNISTALNQTTEQELSIVSTTPKQPTVISSTYQTPTSSSSSSPSSQSFINLPMLTVSPKIEKPAELKLIQNVTTSPTLKPEMTWTLVSTVAPHKPTMNSDDTRTPLPNRQEPSSVDLVPKPLQGFGLEDSTSALDTDVFQFTELCNELAFSFWSSVTSGISFARSVIVSPFAATSMLAMVFLGARGSTSGEMNEILKLDDMVTFNPHSIFKNVIESIEVSKKSGVAVSVFVKELYSDKNKGKLLSFYKERVKQFYDGHVEEVNFREINDVIRRRTNLLIKRQTWGKIQEFLKDNNIFVRPPLAAVSANVFQTDCSEASTNRRDGELHFVVLPSIRQRKLVPIPAVVWRSGFLAGYDPGLDATAVAIGTKDQTISTIFVIPGQQGISAPGDGLMRLEARLIESAFRQGAWSRLLRSLIPRPGLEVQIPRFLHKSVINATMALQRMGLKDLFNSNKADLKGLNGVAHELYLSDIIQVNTFATCGEGRIDETHHSEVYPATTNRSFRRIRKIQHYHQNERHLENSDTLGEPRDYQRAFHDPLYDPSYLSLPLQLRPRQARLPEAPRLRFDRPFLYFVRHNPTGLILHMGRFNPRLLP